MRIFLIGFMGAGKTYAGRLLAEKLGFDFVDLDHFITEKAGQSITQLFAESGEAAFRQLEQSCLKETQDWSNVVIATGGGAPCFFDNMEWINQQGIAIFLDASIDIIWQRLLKGAYKRPLVAQKTPVELKTYIEETLAARRPFYEQAAVIYRIDSLRQNAALDLADSLPDLIGH